MVSWLESAIQEHCAFELGQLRVEPGGDGWDVHGPGTGAIQERIIESEDTEALRRFVQCDDAGGYRPLSGAQSLPSAWKAHAGDSAALLATLEVIYPLATHHIAQQAQGSLRVVGLDSVLERQSGRYEKASKLSENGRGLATEVVCGQCVREPAWISQGASPSMFGVEEGTGFGPAGRIPCPEPCSIMVSFCREAAQWEAEMPLRAPENPAVGFAAFETPGNALREQWLAARAPGEVLVMEDCSGIPADSRH